jgi:phosphate transport system substrate-binding protein
MVTYNRPHEREIIPKERSPVLIRRRKVFSGCAAAILAALLAAGPRSAVADTIRISGIGGAAETIRLLGEAFRKVRPDVRFALLPSIGSEGAVKAVVAGDLDIGLCARPLTGEERAQGAVETRYARTPLAFGVNRSVKTSGLTLASVVEIYAGKRNYWEDGSRVRLILRPPTDSDAPVLKRMSPEMDVAVESASRRVGMTMAMTDEDLANAIEKTPGAFGATTLALVVSEKRAIRVLALNGIVPSVRALVDGSYPYSRMFCMVTRKHPPAAVRRFIDFVRSSAGASILAKNGQAAVR